MAKMDKDILSRAQGCLLGQCAGDALGQMVEFMSKEAIRHQYPNGVCDMKNGGVFNTLAGQPTDDTEMALMLARSIVKEKKFDAKKVFDAYRFWIKSNPFDCGNTVMRGLTGSPNEESQANGSLMRISPLGIYGSQFELDTVADWAMQDSRLTHPHIVCQKAVAVYTTTIAEAIATGLNHEELYNNALKRAKEKLYFELSVYEALQRAAYSVPDDFKSNVDSIIVTLKNTFNYIVFGRIPRNVKGWVLTALQNAFYRLLHAKDTEQAIIETVNEGGDTDTNGAICGALLGAVYSIESIPTRWRNAVLNCRPSADNPDAKHPRPECFWTVDVLELVEELLTV